MIQLPAFFMYIGSPISLIVSPVKLSYYLLQDPCDVNDEKCESRLYIGNLDVRITE